MNECCVCGLTSDNNDAFRNKDGRCYCKKHYFEKLREENKELLQNTSGDDIIKKGLPRTPCHPSRNKFYEFPDVGDGVLAIKDNKRHVFIADLEDKDKLDYKTWGERDENRHNNYCYTTVYLKGKVYAIAMHRLVMMNGNNLDGMVVDHKDGNGYDNRKSNLRICTQSENSMNRGPVCGRPVSGINKRGKDVEPNSKNRKTYYEARIGYRREEYRKCFDTYEEAQAWRKQKEHELFGEYAVDQRESDGVYAEIYDRVKSVRPAIHFDDPKKEAYYNF